MKAFIEIKSPKSYTEAVAYFNTDKPKSVKRTYFTVLSKKQAEAKQMEVTQSAIRKEEINMAAYMV